VTLCLASRSDSPSMFSRGTPVPRVPLTSFGMTLHEETPRLTPRGDTWRLAPIFKTASRLLGGLERRRSSCIKTIGNNIPSQGAAKLFFLTKVQQNHEFFLLPLKAPLEGSA
jgi:hypothetical protein